MDQKKRIVRNLLLGALTFFICLNVVFADENNLSKSISQREIAILIDQLIIRNSMGDSSWNEKMNYPLEEKMDVKDLSEWTNQGLKDVTNETEEQEVDPVQRILKQGVLENTKDFYFDPNWMLNRTNFADVYFNLIHWLYQNKPMILSPTVKNAVSLEDLKALLYNASIEKAKFLVGRGLLSSQFTNVYNWQLSKSEAQNILKRAFVNSLPFTSSAVDCHVVPGPYISQLRPVYAPVGCEATSLLMGLKAKNYAQNVDLRSFLDAMPKTASNPSNGFVGSPYVPDPKKKTRTTIFPAKLTEFAKAYGNVVDITGASSDELKYNLLNNVPVVVYMTMRYENPYYRWYSIENNEGRYWLSNNHAVLIAGYDRKTDRYYIRDPYNVNNMSQPFEYWIDAAGFDKIYNERRYAIAVF